jgi:hypothetical protein
VTQMLTDRPLDDIEGMEDNERGCDSRVVDTKVQPWRTVSQCPRPAEWIYVMKCCGGQALACGPCHDIHMNPPPRTKQRHCIHCQHPFTTIGEGCSAVYRV